MSGLSLVSMLTVATIGLLNSTWFDVDEVVVVGTDRTDPGLVVEISGIRSGDALADLNLSAAHERVARLPWVADVAIDRSWDGRVVIAVEERRPAAALPTTDGYVVIDQTGVLLERSPTRPEGFIPVEGIVASGELGEVAPPEAALVLNLQAALPDELMARISGVSIDGDEIVAQLSTGGQILFGDSLLLGEKIQAAETMLARVDLSCVAVIDVRVPGAPAVRRGEMESGAPC